MPISQTQLLNEISEGHDGAPIPEPKLTYMRERLRWRLFEFILGSFQEEQANGLTKAKLARRIGKSPEVINRWLAAPSNLTTDSFSDLLVGIKAAEPEMAYKSLLHRPPSNYEHLVELEESPGSKRLMRTDNDLPPPRRTNERVHVL